MKMIKKKNGHEKKTEKKAPQSGFFWKIQTWIISQTVLSGNLSPRGSMTTVLKTFQIFNVYTYNSKKKSKKTCNNLNKTTSSLSTSV